MLSGVLEYDTPPQRIPIVLQSPSSKVNLLRQLEGQTRINFRSLARQIQVCRCVNYHGNIKERCHQCDTLTVSQEIGIDDDEDVQMLVRDGDQFVLLGFDPLEPAQPYFFRTSLRLGDEWRTPQRDALLAIRNYFGTQVRSKAALLVIPTGCGKTGIICAAPYGLCKGKVLIVAPGLVIKKVLTDNLVHLASQKDSCDCFLGKRQALEDHDLPTEADVLVLSKRVSPADVARTSAQFIVTNVHQAERAVIGSPDLLGQIGMLIVDEAHRAPARKWRELEDALHKANPNLLVVYLTATPDRTDQQQLDAEECYKYPLDVAMERNYVKHLLFGEVRPSDATRLPHDPTRDLFAYIPLVHARLLALNKVRLGGKKLKILGVAKTQDDAKTLAERFNAFSPHLRAWYYFPSDTLELPKPTFWGAETRPRYQALVAKYTAAKTKKHRIVLELFDEDAFDMLIQVDALKEGWDSPYVSMVVWFRTQRPRSILPFAQANGRALRFINDPTLPKVQYAAVLAHYYKPEVPGAVPSGMADLWERYKERSNSPHTLAADDDDSPDEDNDAGAELEDENADAGMEISPSSALSDPDAKNFAVERRSFLPKEDVTILFSLFPDLMTVEGGAQWRKIQAQQRAIQKQLDVRTRTLTGDLNRQGLDIDALLPVLSMQWRTSKEDFVPGSISALLAHFLYQAACQVLWAEELIRWREKNGKFKPLAHITDLDTLNDIFQKLFCEARRLDEWTKSVVHRLEHMALHIDKSDFTEPRQRPRHPLDSVGGGPPSRNTGFANLGNTCYLSAMLVALLSCRRFIDDLCATESQSPLCQSFQDVARAFRTGGLLSIEHIRQGLSDARFSKGSNQEDPHELLIHLFDCLNSSFRAERESPVTVNFSAATRSVLQCPTDGCPNRYTESEDPQTVAGLVLSLPDPAPKNVRILTLLNRYMAAEQVACRCDGCGTESKQKTLRIHALSRYLTLVLQRPVRGNDGQEENIVIDPVLDLSDLEHPPENCAPYAIVALVCHHGADLHHGHYTALVRGEGKWQEYDDREVTDHIDFEMALASLFESDAQPYVVFYERS